MSMTNPANVQAASLRQASVVRERRHAAARRQKIFELILPEANRGDFEELPDYLKEGLTVHFAKRFADVAKVLF